MNLHQMGMAEESTYGTFVAPTRFFEILPGETLERRQTILQSNGIRAGNLYRRGANRAIVKDDAGGSVDFEVWTNNFGLLFKHMLGDNVTTANPLATAYQHTFEPGSLDGLSMSWQKGIENDGGTATPFSYTGVKVASWTLSNSVDEILQLSLELDAKEEITSESLAVASYPANAKFFHFQQGTVEIDDTIVAAISTFEVTGTNALDNERYFLGSAGKKAEQRENDFRTITGNFTADFINTTEVYDRFTADTSAKIELIFDTGVEIETGYTEKVHVTLNDCRFTGETPKAASADVAEISAPFEAIKPAAGEAISILYQTTDTLP